MKPTEQKLRKHILDLLNAVSKACGDNQAMVKATIKSQGGNYKAINQALTEPDHTPDVTKMVQPAPDASGIEAALTRFLDEGAELEPQKRYLWQEGRAARDDYRKGLKNAAQDHVVDVNNMINTSPDVAELVDALIALRTVVVKKNNSGADWGDLMGELLAALDQSRTALEMHEKGAA